MHPGDRMSNTFVVVLVTFASKPQAEKICAALLEKRLIACANVIGPVSSHFHWSGQIENAEEHIVLMKSRMDLLDKLVKCVKTLHTYEVPEILALPIVGGSKGYLDWLSGVFEES